VKKCLLLCTGLFCLLMAEAQYKKASFLNKTGRIYDIGTTFRILGNERSTAMGFFMSYGKESTTKRIHHWFDLEFMSGTKFRYTSVAQSDPNIPVLVNGNTGFEVGFRYTLAYFLADNSDEEKKLLPFANLSVGYTNRWAIGEETYTPDTYPEKSISGESGALTYGGGGGVVYRFTPGVGLRFSVAYYGVTDDDQSEGEVFKKIVSHPAVNLAVRFRMKRRDE
jgi:hypothetical protein